MPSYVPNWSEIQDVLDREIQNLIVRKKSTIEAMKDAAEQINKLVGK